MPVGPLFVSGKERRSVAYAVEFDFSDLVGHTTAGNVDGDLVADFMTEKGATDRGVDGNGSLGEVGFSWKF